MDWYRIAALAQATLCVYFTVVHWVPLFPWNNLTVRLFPEETRVNLVWTIVIAIGTVGYISQIHWLMIVILIFWNVWMVGHIFAWWVPYFRGASEKEMEDYKKVFGTTLKFLPAIGNHPIPDACHTVLGVLSAVVFVSSWMAMIQIYSN